MKRASRNQRSRRNDGAGQNFLRRDFARRKGADGGWRLTAVAAVAGLVLGGLLLASLRMEIVRERYALADALALETALVAEELAASVELRELRDPRRLRRLANELGFARPERVIELGTDSAPRPDDLAARSEPFAAQATAIVVP
jgi:hypothetical protein